MPVVPALAAATDCEAAAAVAEEIADVVGAYEEAGAYRIMLQWMDLDDFNGLEALAKALL